MKYILIFSMVFENLLKVRQSLVTLMVDRNFGEQYSK